MMNQRERVSLPPISDILHVISQPVGPPRAPQIVNQAMLPPIYVKASQTNQPHYIHSSQPKSYNYDYWTHGGVYATPPLRATSSKSPLPCSISPIYNQESTPPPLNLRNNSDPVMNVPYGSNYYRSNFINSPSEDGEVNPGHVSNSKRKTRNNLPKETTYVLLKWLNDHLNHPYPNSFEKNQLMISTGLNQQQLSNWFINARRRKIKLLKEQKRLNLI